MRFGRCWTRDLYGKLAGEVSWSLGFGIWDLGLALAKPALQCRNHACSFVFCADRARLARRDAGRADVLPSPDTKGPDSSLIRLDIHPTADGHPVQDLAAADLDLIEDGTPQKIETLTHATDPARSFVVFLDTPHMRFEGARDVRVALVRFLDRLSMTTMLVGVMTPDITPADIKFGPKASVIAGIMQDETLWERARVGSRDPKEDRYAQCFPPTSTVMLPARCRNATASRRRSIRFRV